MKTKNAFHWKRQFSAIPGGMEIPPGVPVELHDGIYYVKPSFFSNAVFRHDATYYGCRVEPDNVESEAGDEKNI